MQFREKHLTALESLPNLIHCRVHGLLDDLVYVQVFIDHGIGHFKGFCLIKLYNTGIHPLHDLLFLHDYSNLLN